jgi:hypothetical protein
MFDHRHYVPILKGKAGEYQALKELKDQVKNHLTPLIEIPSIPWDFENDVPGKTVDEHLVGVAANIEKHWGTERPMFVDLLWLPSPTATADGRPTVTYVFDDARSKGLQLIPVTGLTRAWSHQDAVREIVARDQRGVCVRLVSQDFEDLLDLDTTLENFLTLLGVTPRNTDLIVDFKEITAGQASPLTIAIISIIKSLPSISDWRSITVAASAFPLNLSNLEASSVTPVPRAEWSIWESLARKRAKLPRMPTFGDYAISHPDIVEIDPRMMRMSAQLRYTTETDWLIFKGRNVRDYGYEQIVGICKTVSERPEFKGELHCWGDTFIGNCGAGYGGPGSATTWRKLGTNHHLTLVVDQIANLPGL